VSIAIYFCFLKVYSQRIIRICFVVGHLIAKADDRATDVVAIITWTAVSTTTSVALIAFVTYFPV